MRRIFFVIFIIFLITILYFYNTTVVDSLHFLQQYCTQNGIRGILLFSAFYILSILAFIPGSAPTVLAGVLYGSITGSIIVFVSATIASVLSFLLARYFFSASYIERYLAKYPHFQTIQATIETHGKLLIILTRLIPLFPFSFLNYAFGITNISLKEYTLWTMICIIPGVLLYVVGADTITQIFLQEELPFVSILISVLLLLISFILYKFGKKMYNRIF